MHYPDTILLTKNPDFDPSRDCGDSIWNFKNYTSINNSYNNYNCNLNLVPSAGATFKLIELNSGNYQWACKIVDEMGESKFSEKRTFSSVNSEQSLLLLPFVLFDSFIGSIKTIFKIASLLPF